MKPFDNKKLIHAVKEALHFIDLEKEKYVVLEYNHQLEKILIDDIYYVESDKRKLHIYGKFGKRSIYQKLDDFEKKVEGFIRCHKSYLENTKYMISLTKDKVVLFNEKKIPISYQRYKMTREQFLCLFDHDL